MRTYGTPRKLTYESFIETFGKEPAREIEGEQKDLPKISAMLSRPMEIASSILKTPGTKSQRNVDQEMTSVVGSLERVSPLDVATPTQQKATRVEKMSKRLRKISLRKKDSKSSVIDGSKTNSLQRSKSVSFLGKSVTSPSWLSSPFNLSIHQKSGRKSPVNTATESPMSKIASAACRGYLSKITNSKKNTQTRYWCILADSCLYCYSSQNDEFADDVIALGGYWLATNGKESKYTSASHSHNHMIILERFGKESYEFKADDEASFNKWMAALTESLATKQSVTKLTRSVSSSQRKTKRTLVPVYERSVSDICMDVSTVKAKLLEQVLAQQKQIQLEQEMLEKLATSNQEMQLQQQPKEQQPQRQPLKVVSFSFSNSTKASSISSLAQSEDNGYSSSLDGFVLDTYSENVEPRQPSPTARSYRSMSTISAASSISVSSNTEDKKGPSEVSPKVLAEIEEFRLFSKKTLERKLSEVPSV